MKRFFYVKLFTFHFSVLNYPYYKDETTKCSTCGIPLGFFYVWVVFAKKDTINYKKIVLNYHIYSKKLEEF